jgi:hypothetical protein
MNDSQYNTDGSKKKSPPTKAGEARSVLDAEILAKAQKEIDDGKKK